MSTAPGSSDRFGYEWSHYNEIDPIYEEQFKRWTVFIPPSDWRGKSFLDVGCGMGRNSYWPLSYGASRGVSIDLNEGSLNSARKNLQAFSNASIQKMSAYDIPFENEFDVVFSLGVIHHIEDPQLALKKMYAATKPGGKVLVWVYGYENNEWIVKYFNVFRTTLFCKLPISVTHFLSLFPTAFLWLALRLGLSSLEYFKLIRKFSFRHLRSIVFDQMLPKIAHYWKRDEVVQLLTNANLKNIQISHVNGISWCAIGTK